MYIFFCMLSFSKGADISIRINEVEKQLPFQTINSINYIEIESLALILNQNAIPESTIINFKNETLKFAAGSFFVAYENDGKLRVSQMSLPCLESGSLLIPWDAFINSMQGVNLISYSKKYGKYLLKTELFVDKVIQPKPILIIDHEAESNVSKPKPKDTIQTDLKKIGNTKLIDSSDFQSNEIDSNTSPTKYIIPKGLVK